VDRTEPDVCIAPPHKEADIMTAASSILLAVVFVWLGMVVAISFIEAPLKFRAPGVTLQIGLGIGRMVFRALNTVEVIFAVVLMICLVFVQHSTVITVALICAAASIGCQLIFVGPALARRSNAVLEGANTPRSWAHHAYIALEVIKTAALITGGVAALMI
jgi:hypothetical protein